MKVDSSSIDKRALHRLLKDRYGLCAAVLSFVPQGEESYGYILETLAQSRFFVKVYEHASELDVRYKAANRLHTQCGLEFVVYPHATRHGEFHADLGEYAVAVFDFVDGTVSDQSGFSDEEWKQAAILTASLHKSVQCPALPSLPVEWFEIWFEDWLLRVLSATEDTKPLDSECEGGARKLLTCEKNDILMTLERLKQLAERARTTTFEQALTHGDLKPENLIKDSGGRLHLIDWSKIAIAPPERDLVNFVGERFGLFLEAYVSSYDKAPRLHPELFEFYSYFLNLWGIADYGSWILLEDAHVAEKEHAWMELQQHLPVNHEQVQADGVRQAIRGVTGAG
jgi:Ser/Thr protein kinase RdoA (MazF antagonist)